MICAPSSFLLYPTYEHETERLGDVQPCFGQWLREEEARKPGRDQVRIEAMAQVTDVVRVDSRERLLALAPQHIWSPQFVHGRYDWEPYKPVFVLLLRAFALPQPHLLPVRREYGGCRSWVELAEPISVDGATPAISEDSYARRRELTLRLWKRGSEGGVGKGAWLCHAPAMKRGVTLSASFPPFPLPGRRPARRSPWAVPRAEAGRC